MIKPRKNEYGHLRVDERLDGINVVPAKRHCIYQDEKESIILLISEVQPGKYAYGYSIYFENGRSAIRQIGDLDGWFHSHDDALLYFLGYVLQYREHFSNDCVLEVKKQVLNMIQTTLF